MVKHANITKLLILCLLIFSTFSCRKVFKPTEWHPEAVFPIAYTDLTLKNLITDTTHLQSDSAGVATLFFEQKLDSLSFDVLDTIHVPPFYNNFKLDSLKLTVPPFVQTLTFGQLARALQASSDPSTSLLGNLILSFQGRTLASDPFISLLVQNTIPIPLGKIPINLNQFFQSATLRSGTLDLKIINNFPMKVNDLDFAIENASDSAVLIQETGIQIDKNSVFEKVYDLSGKTVEGQLVADVSKLELLTDKNAVIDTNQAIQISMTFSDLQVESATAIFPEQDVISDHESVALEDMGQLELKEALVLEGSVALDVTSTIQDSIFMTFVMPKATLLGVPLVFNGVVPPAPVGGSRTTHLEVPVDHYALNLSAPPDYFNTLEYDFTAHVKYTGKKVYLSLEDSVVISIATKGIRPEYVRGYLGSLDTSFSSNFTTDIFSKIPAVSLVPATVNARLKVVNGLGVKGEVEINVLTASNKNGEALQAQDDSLVGIPLPIAAATNPPFQEVTTVVKSSSNSNFPSIVSLFPDQFAYEIHATVGVGEKDTNSFVFSNSKLKPTLEIEMPLNLSLHGLVLRDTIALQSSYNGMETVGGALSILAYNGFPFSATVRIIFIQSPLGQTVVLNGDAPMLAADVDPVTGRAITKKYSKITLPFSSDDLTNISLANQVIIEAIFDTPSDQKVKVYSDESAQLTLTGKLVPKISK